MADAPTTDFSDLKAMIINCTLKPSPELSHTEGLLRIPTQLFSEHGVTVDQVRAVDLDLPPGVQPDMREHGFATDDWPALFERVMAADILIVATPIWLGEKSSVCNRVVERLYGNSGLVNDKGQWAYYGRVGGCIVTGNEDGAKHCAMNLLYSLQHLGYAIPPQADAAWLGSVGPGPSYLDEGSGGPETDFTNRNATFMAWNLMHLARMLKDQGGIPAYGNLPGAWKDGEHFGFHNPEYR
jgi:multimeric flavodoxin WrbA